MEQLQILHTELGHLIQAKAENEHLRLTLAELDATIKGQADTIRLSQEEQKALQEEITQLNNTIKLLKEQLEKPVAPVVPPVVKESREPFKMTKGGVYKNLFIGSTDSNIACVDIATNEAFTFENCIFESAGHVFKNHNNQTNGKIINVQAKGLPASTDNGDARRFMSLNYIRNLEVYNCDVEGMGFLTSQHDFVGDVKTQGLKVMYNNIRNISGTKKTTRKNANFVQLMNIFNGMPVEVAFNRVTNEHGPADLEDNVNVFNARGLADNPMKFHNNLIIGAFYHKLYENTKQYAGGGMITDGGEVYEKATAYVHFYENYVIGTGNYGIGFGAGHHNKAYDNVVVNAAILPNGQPYHSIMDMWTSGIWAYLQKGYLGKMDNNIMERNILGVNYKGRRQDISADRDAIFRNNIHLSGEITKATEQKYIQEWENNHRNLTIGLLK